jgi:hypothetical protein
LNLPDKLYKYESFSVQSLLNLKNQTVFFASPSEFNDPFDCAIKAELKDPTEEEIIKLRDIYLSRDWPNHVINALKTTPLARLKPTLIRAVREANEEIIDTFIKTKGVSCFSEVNDELLMWAHYSNKYTGFCLEFSTNNELFEKAHIVEYVDQMPKLNILHAYGDSDQFEMLRLFCTKSKSWEYEKEWRVIHDEVGTAYTYPTNALTGVYFGPKMPRDIIEIICIVLQAQNRHVKFWKGRRSETKFKVEFEQVFFTPALKVEDMRFST